MSFERISRLSRRALAPLVATVCAALALRRLDDFDTWWHLASGRWIVEHGEVPHTDTLSYTVPDHAWINLQWLYDVALYGMYQLGGDDVLVLGAAAMFVATAIIVLRTLRLRLGEVGSAVIALWMIFVIEERFTIRPEQVSFVLLAAVVWLLVAAPRDQGRRLWLLPVVMLLWVNCHSLFIIGLFCIAAATAGALAARTPVLPPGWRDNALRDDETTRRLVIASAASAAITILNPYLLEGVMFPLKLMSRIDGSSSAFQAIGEFRRPFSNYFPTFAISAYQGFFIVGLTVVAIAAVVSLGRARRSGPREEAGGVAGFDVGLVVAFLGLAYISTLARRNIGIFAVAAAPIVGLCLAEIIDRSGRAARESLVRAGDFAAPALALGCMLVTGVVVTNDYYRWSEVTHEFGLGTMEVSFPIHAAEFAGEAELPGRMYNDLTAGGYLTWESGVEGGVFIDGRLEVYDTEFFSEYLSGMSNVRVFSQQIVDWNINTVLLFHRWGNRHGLIRLLMRDPGWTLVYHDEVAVVFVRNQGNMEAVRRAQALFPSWHERTERRLSEPVSSWQRPIARATELDAYAALLTSIGSRDRAVEAYDDMLELDLTAAAESRIRFRLGLLLARSGDRNRALLELGRARDLDPSNKRIEQVIKDLGG